MKDILSQAHVGELRRFLTRDVVFAFDYDGTLAPIVDDPDQAWMRESTRELLEELARLQRVIVISGRARKDAARRLRGVKLVGIVGNHGGEPWNADSRQIALVRRWLPLLEASAARHRGVVIEDKAYSVAIHYRHASEKQKARQAMVRAAGALGDVRIVGGKEVVNVLPESAPHKGLALRAELDRLHCDEAIYVGDAETDEDVFALDEPENLLCIRVGADRESRAPYFISDQGAIDDLLHDCISHLARRER